MLHQHIFGCTFQRWWLQYVIIFIRTLPDVIGTVISGHLSTP